VAAQIMPATWRHCNITPAVSGRLVSDKESISQTDSGQTELDTAGHNVDSRHSLTQNC
jgi:hypothetical protein